MNIGQYLRNLLQQIYQFLLTDSYNFLDDLPPYQSIGKLEYFYNDSNRFCIVFEIKKHFIDIVYEKRFDIHISVEDVLLDIHF